MSVKHCIHDAQTTLVPWKLRLRNPGCLLERVNISSELAKVQIKVAKNALDAPRNQFVILENPLLIVDLANLKIITGVLHKFLVALAR